MFERPADRQLDRPSRRHTAANKRQGRYRQRQAAGRLSVTTDFTPE